MKSRRSVLLVIASAGALLVFALALAVFLYPLRFMELNEELSVRFHGAREFRSGGLQGFVKDNCHGGSACTCVSLVHGMSDSALRWRKILNMSDEQWRKAGAEVSFRLYAWDLPGIDGSEAPATLAGYRVRTQAETLQKAMAPLCSNWILVGNSLGGWISVWVTLQWPQGVSRLLLVDSAGLKIDLSDPIAAMFHDPQPEQMRDFLRRLFYKPPDLPDRVIPAVVERIRKRHSVEIVNAQVAEDFVEPYAPSIRRPTMVFWGENDGVFSDARGKALAALIPGAIWREVPKCGHLPEAECPADMAKAIVDLSKVGRF